MSAKSVAMPIPIGPNVDSKVQVDAYEDDLELATKRAVDAAIKYQKSGAVEKKTKFPIDSYPEKIQSIISEVHSVTGFTLDYYFAGVNFAFLVALGNKVEAHFKSSWREAMIGWNGVIGPSGSGKSPAIKWGLRPIRKREENLQQLNLERERDRQADIAARKEAGDVKSGEVFYELAKREVLLQKLTTEAVTKKHERNLHGIGVFQDELRDWIEDILNNSSRNDSGFWLSAFDGGMIKVSRSTDTSNRYISKSCINVIGGIQPKLLPILAQGGNRDNGFLYRILYYYPEKYLFPDLTDKEVHPDVINEYDSIVNFLYDMPSLVEEPETINQLGICDRMPIRMDNDARTLFLQYVNNGQREKRENEEDGDILGVNSKMASVCLRFACMLEFMEYAAANHGNKALDKHPNGGWDFMPPKEIVKQIKITEQSVFNAIDIVSYFKKNSLKILSNLDDPASSLKDYQKIWHKHCLDSIKAKDAIAIGEAITKAVGSCGLSKSTTKKLIKNESLFYKRNQRDKFYRKRDE